MFGGRFSSSCGALGIDIGSRSIKMLQLSRARSSQGGALSVVGAAEEPIARSGADGVSDAEWSARLGDRLRSAFTVGGFAGRQCVVSLPREDVHVQAVRLPRMPDAELREAAAWEAAERFGMTVGEMEVDVLRTGAGSRSGGATGPAVGGGASEGREEVLLIAASHETIHRRIEPILNAGLRPVAIDTHFGAIARIFSRRFRRESDQQFVRAILEVGTSGSTILILRGEQIAFCKAVPIGGRRFSEAVAEHLQLDVGAADELRSNRILRTTNQGNATLRVADHPPQRTEHCSTEHSGASHPSEASTDRAIYEATRPLLGELVKEMMLCLRYFGVTFRGRPADRIMLTGGESLEPHLAQMLQSSCKLPVVFDDEIDTLGGLLPGIQSKLHRTPGPAASWAVAAGLSARLLRDGSVVKDEVAAGIANEAGATLRAAEGGAPLRAANHDAERRGAEGRGAEGRGAEGRGAEGRGAEGRGTRVRCT